MLKTAFRSAHFILSVIMFVHFLALITLSIVQQVTVSQITYEIQTNSTVRIIVVGNANPLLILSLVMLFTSLYHVFYGYFLIPDDYMEITSDFARRHWKRRFLNGSSELLLLKQCLTSPLMIFVLFLIAGLNRLNVILLGMSLSLITDVFNYSFGFNKIIWGGYVFGFLICSIPWICMFIQMNDDVLVQSVISILFVVSIYEQGLVMMWIDDRPAWENISEWLLLGIRTFSCIFLAWMSYAILTP